MSHPERRFDPKHHAALNSAERAARWQPMRLLQRLDIRPGQTVLDLGCGPGFWTFPLADIAGPQGIVWALDISQEMLDDLVEHHPPAQVHPLRSELPQISLPDASVDWIWGAFMAHEVEPLADLIKEARRVLRPGGRVGLLDWRPDAVHEDGPPRHHRLDPEVVRRALQENGFRLIAFDWEDEDAYLILAE
ncbi:MAG: class I SAM-dependent methyltransferase [Anaerolineales bacterium]